jgi:TRAP-type C4-dicarboxylate transport system substrate-binding protein
MGMAQPVWMVAKGPFYVKILVTCCWVVLLKLIYETVYQDAVKKIGEECLKELVELIQKDNLKAHKVLGKNNLKWVSLPGEKEKARFQEAGARARKKLAEKYFPAELVDEVLNHLKEFRH